MNANELKPGSIVRGPMLPEPIEVLVVTLLGDVIKIVGAGQKTGQVHQRVLRLDQLQFLDATPEREPFDGDPARFRLGIEAARLGLAYEYDPYFSLSISRVDPLPHQLEAVYDYFMRLPHPVPPRRRPRCGEDDHGGLAPQGAKDPRPREADADRRAGEPLLSVAARAEGKIP